MTTTQRVGPIAEFPEATLDELVDRLRRITSRELAVGEWLLVFDPSGKNIPSGGAAFVDVGPLDVVDFADAGVDQCRVVATGSVGPGGGGVGIAISVFDVTNNRELARTGSSTGPAAGLAVGPWTVVPLKGSDALLVVRVLFASGGSITVTSVRLQARTSKIVL